MARRRQSIGLNFAAKCNAACEHCCVNSSPRASARLSDEMAEAIIDDAIAHPDVVEVGLTGGEPLLRREFALSLIRRGTEGGLRMTCVTNGYWGQTPAKADAMFTDLCDAGLESLTISYDDFHADFVSVETIRNVLDASKKTKLSVILNMAVSRSRDSGELLQSLGSSAYCIQITRYPVIPAGEANDFDASEFIRESITEANTRCPGLEVIFHHDGRVLPCCSPGVFDTHLALAPVGESIEHYIRKIERNALLAIMQREGLLWFQNILKDELPESDAARTTEIVSACELCTVIFRSRHNLDILRPHVLAYFGRAQGEVRVEL